MVRPLEPWQRIVYRSEPAAQRDDGIGMSHLVLVQVSSPEVVWGFHPHLPAGMHWKKGDETGLGSDHWTAGRQTYDEFVADPRFELTPDVKRAVEAAIERAKAERAR